MNLFTRKLKVPLEDFCRDFYNRHIFHTVINGVDARSVYLDVVRKEICRADSSFHDVDSDLLLAEMAALHIEVFGLAWLHQLGDKHAAAQSSFTKKYLEECGRSEIWETMEHYNQAIARSSTAPYRKDTPVGRAGLTFVNSIRLETWKKWKNQGFDLACIARAANRLATEVPWKDRITPSFLMLMLCDRLSYEFNEEAQFRLTATIVGLYDGARQSLHAVRIES